MIRLRLSQHLVRRASFAILPVLALAVDPAAGQSPVVAQTTPPPVVAQQPPPPPSPQPAQTPRPPQPEQTPRPPVVPGPPVPRGLAVNVKIDVTITELGGAGQPVTKTVTMTLADREPGRIRTTTEALQVKGADMGPVRHFPLNVDATAEMIEGTKVRVRLNLEYDAWEPDVQRGIRPTSQIREAITVILESGKSLMVSQSADPLGDRKVTVEARATILR
jgi:hypothetical protein